jgi:predicted Zn-dependent protease
MQVQQKGRPSQGVALFFFLSSILCAQTADQVAQSQRAKQFLGEGRFSEAAAIYQGLVRAMPTNVGLRLNLGLALHMAGNHADSIPEFEAVLKSQPSALPALVSLGTAHLQLNQAAKAIDPLTRAVALQPANIDVRGMLANALLSLDRAAEAAPHFRKLTSLAPADPRAWTGLGKSYELLAAKSFEEIPNGSPEWLSLIGDTRLVRGQYRAAFYFYKQALEKKPAFRGIHTDLAKVYRATGNAEWAAAEEAAEKKIPAPNCVTEKAECDFLAGRFLNASTAAKSPYWRTRAFNELATRAFAQIGKLPPSVDLFLLKAEIATQRGQFAEAVKEYEGALRLSPSDPRLQRDYAAALYFARDYKRAIPLLEKEMSRDPKNAELYFFIGDSYLRQEQVDEALTYLKAAVAYDAKLLPARAALGQALVRAAKPAEAIPHLEAALPMDEDGSVQYQLSRAYQAAGETEKARAALAKYQEIRKKLDADKQDLEEQVKITPP